MRPVTMAIRCSASLLILTSLLTAPPPAQAVIDPQPNGIGVYFDLAADINHQMVDVPDGEEHISFDAYVLVTNPTFTTFNACAFGYRIVVPEGMESSIAVVNAYIRQRIEPWDGNFTDPLEDFYGAGFTLPIVTDTTMLAKWYVILYETMPVEFYLMSAVEAGAPDCDCYWNTPLPVVYIGDETVDLHVSSGSSSLPVAAINTDIAPVAEQGASWGAVKALFR